MLSIWKIIRKLPLCICIHWSVYFLLINFKPFQDMTLRKIHRIKSVVLLFASIVAGLIGKFCKLSMLLEIAIMCFILAIIEYIYMSFPKDNHGT